MSGSSLPCLVVIHERKSDDRCADVGTMILQGVGKVLATASIVRAATLADRTGSSTLVTPQRISDMFVAMPFFDQGIFAV